MIVKILLAYVIDWKLNNLVIIKKHQKDFLLFVKNSVFNCQLFFKFQVDLRHQTNLWITSVKSSYKFNQEDIVLLSVGDKPLIHWTCW